MSGNPVEVIGLLDVDSFECQIFQNENPEWKGQPCVVAVKGGRIVSVTAEAKRLGINRNESVNDLRFQLLRSHIKIFWRPQVNNKPDSTKCRTASLEITDVITKFCRKRKIIVERVPMDEWFLDLTNHIDYLTSKRRYSFPPDFTNDNVYLEGKISFQEDDLTDKMRTLGAMCTSDAEEIRLILGAGVVNNLCNLIHEKLGFNCSAGISYNKLLAKQASKIHKPEENTLTILSSFGFNRVSQDIPIRDVWGLGGELGNQLEESLPHVQTMANLRKVSKNKLKHLFGDDDGELLYDKARGICEEEVQMKIITQTVNCSKANLRVKSYKSLRFHLDNLSRDMCTRLAEESERNNRYTTSLKIQFTYYYENDEEVEESSIERTFDYDGEDFRDIAQFCFLEIREWGFHPYNQNDDTVISQLKLTAKNFYNYEN